MNVLAFLNRRFALFLALVTLLTSVYMLTYSGRILSGDELYLFDATGSLVHFNDFLLSITTGTRPPQAPEPSGPYPLPIVDAEPLQIILAAPLYWLTDHVPGVGLVHAVWLFNVMVCALAAGVLFLYARTLGYNDRTAVLGALALGLGTVVWPYTKSFFREPLAMLLLLIAGLCAERWRQSHYRGLGWALAMIAAIIGMALTKAPSMLALPALFIIALPSLRSVNRRVLAGLAVAAALVVGLFVVLALFGDQLGVGSRYNPLARLVRESRSYLPIALHSYLLSIGGSVWATSPVALLAIPGLWMLVRQGRARYVVVILLVVLAFAVGYATVSGPFWFGGLSWPPRFLVPAVPFLVIGALPVFERLTRRPVPRLLLIALMAVMVYSVWVQISGVTLAWGDYAQGLPPEANGLLEWGGGLNDVSYLRWVIIPGLWSRLPLDFAWKRAGLDGWPVAFGLLAVASSGALIAILRSEARRRWATVLLPVALVAFIAVGLRGLYTDPYYAPADRPGLFPMLSILQTETGPNDVLLLSNREYENFFMNYGKLDDVRVIGLGDQPGDRPSESQPPEIVSDNPDVLLQKPIVGLIHSLAATRDRLWLLENKGPDFSWAVRPVERFMASHYYPIRAIQTDPPDPTVRLIEYSTVDAPDPYAFRGPETLTDLVYGDVLRLDGYTLPMGDTYAAGDALPISLSWQAVTALDTDYRVAWFLRAADGSPVAQGMDSRPGGDFEATSAWLPDAPHWDNRALRLPSDLTPGDYRLWVKAYAFDETLTARDLPVTGGETLDGTIGVLPTVIHVE